jgi:transcriptional regulator with XRE-family HTH domain
VTRRPNPVFSEEYCVIREALLAARRRSGMSQRELAARLGKCHSHIVMIERGQRRVDTLELINLGRILLGDPRLLLHEILRRLEAPNLAGGSPRGPEPPGEH